jgi:ADP-ribose pyrophosphatase YjhB (NUDIX family)
MELAAEIIAENSRLAYPALIDAFTAQIGYATPKIDVRGAVFKDGKLLLVRERADGGWTMPGGWADVGDSPSEAVIREMREESGYEAVTTKLAAVLDRNKHPHPTHPQHIYKLFFLCEITGGQPSPSDETSDVAFFGEHEIPELSLGRVLPEQISRLFQHYRNPELPTDYD